MSELQATEVLHIQREKGRIRQARHRNKQKYFAIIEKTGGNMNKTETDISKQIIGNGGLPCDLPVDSLLIDQTYQRDEVSIEKLSSISRKFDWVAFGRITVMQRADGGRYVIDGQQRLAAAKLHGEISVPCLLFYSEGHSAEAKTFITINTNRTNVRAIVKFKASVVANLQPETEINQWLESMQLSAGSPASNSVIEFAESLVLTWKWNSKACRDALVTQRQILGDKDSFSGFLHKGIWLLYDRKVNVYEHVAKLIERGGKIVILQSIRKIQAMYDYKGINYLVCAKGILAVINHGKSRHVIKLDVSGTRFEVR